MANYGYLEFYIEYTLADPNSELSIFTSDSLSFQSTPNTCGNLVENSPLHMTAIPYYNTHQDSNLIIQIHTTPVDSAVMNISYIRIDVDVSSYGMFANPTSINEIRNDNDFNVFSNQERINILTSLIQPYQVSIFNITGQEVFFSTKSGNSTIPFKEESGIYIVRILQENGEMFTKKVLID